MPSRLPQMQTIWRIVPPKANLAKLEEYPLVTANARIPSRHHLLVVITMVLPPNSSPELRRACGHILNAIAEFLFRQLGDKVYSVLSMSRGQTYIGRYEFPAGMGLVQAQKLLQQGMPR